MRMRSNETIMRQTRSVQKVECLPWRTRETASAYLRLQHSRP